jgi:hypothetical protein
MVSVHLLMSLEPIRCIVKKAYFMLNLMSLMLNWELLRILILFWLCVISARLVASLKYVFLNFNYSGHHLAITVYGRWYSHIIFQLNSTYSRMVTMQVWLLALRNKVGWTLKLGISARLGVTIYKTTWILLKIFNFYYIKIKTKMFCGMRGPRYASGPKRVDHRRLVASRKRQNFKPKLTSKTDQFYAMINIKGDTKVWIFCNTL